MILRLDRAAKRSAAPGRRVGLFGLIGSGNLGNDASFEAVLAFLRTEHADVQLTCMCAGPQQVSSRYGIPAVRLNWYRDEYRTASGPAAALSKALGKVVDAVRTARWVRGLDVVIVPGMGVLEASLPLRPWGFPYALFLLTASAKVFGTKVALVSVGADHIPERSTRWLITRAAKLAHYRSYRDDRSRTAMQRMGVDVSRDEVYPDLVFALPVPRGRGSRPGVVGVGVMAYFGRSEDRARAADIHSSYVGKMKRFLRWLVDHDRTVCLFVGDQVDEPVVAELVADLHEYRPDLGRGRVIADPVASLTDLLQQMHSAEVVVATRYHNVLSALKLTKPTISIGYASKNDVLLTEMGLAGFSQPIRSLDVDRLIDQLAELESRRDRLSSTLEERSGAARQRLTQQFTSLSAMLNSARSSRVAS
ncbi:polysaccharide pyruvyl transferase family protein [Pseudonocardia yuanmonensis]|uniref:Polysaccharide pyruvyl transferase family protein n=1 Tax=Pseudonocardia yuanmonensis TaxID=1095914 RepID=A0ABP8VVN3_9PSEU